MTPDSTGSSGARRRVAGTVLIAIGLTVAVGAAADRITSSLVVNVPEPGPTAGVMAFLDLSPVALSVSVGWQRLTSVEPAWRVRSDATLWRQMRFEDWDKIPGSLREFGLERMLRRYGRDLQGPEVWERLEVLDWDAVPAPIRAMAVLRMIDVHVERAGTAALAGHTPREVSDTVGAIVMVESWFEHRAVNVNTNGDQDLGLAQASAGCRRRLAILHQRGEIREAFDEADFFSPWKGSQVAVLWYLRLLREARGDIGLAVRAYHRGMSAARSGEGADYLAQVERKRARFIRNVGAPPSWRFVYSLARFASRSRGDARADYVTALASPAADEPETMGGTAPRLHPPVPPPRRRDGLNSNDMEARSAENTVGPRWHITADASRIASPDETGPRVRWYPPASRGPRLTEARH